MLKVLLKLDTKIGNRGDPRKDFRGDLRARVIDLKKRSKRNKIEAKHTLEQKFHMWKRDSEGLVESESSLRSDLLLSLSTPAPRERRLSAAHTHFSKETFDIGVGYFLYGGYICCRSLVHLFGISFIVVCVRGIFDV